MTFELNFRQDLFRYDIINFIIQKYNFKNYLEIGVDNGETFTMINCENKVSVDPVNKGYTVCQMTSDEYFDMLKDSKKFDVIFIDGLHTYDQCYKDIENAAKHLYDNGFIICHDMNPPTEYIARSISDYDGNGYWTGDVYKAFIKFRLNHYDKYKFCMLGDCDWGIGIITKGKSEPINCDLENLTYDDFKNNKAYLMNCITADDFINSFN